MISRETLIKIECLEEDRLRRSIMDAPIAILSNNSTKVYTINIGSTTGFFAVKNASGATTIYSAGSRSIPASDTIQLWACVDGSNPRISETGGLMTFGAASNEIVYANIKKCKTITDLRLNNNKLTELDARSLNKCTILMVGANANLTDLKVNGMTSLTTFDIQNTALLSIDVSELTGLTTFYCIGAALATGIDTLNALYATLPIFTSGVHTLHRGSDPGSDPGIAMERGWYVM